MAVTLFKVTDFGINQKPMCDLLLLNSTNLYPISHLFRVIVHYRLNLLLTGGLYKNK